MAWGGSRGMKPKRDSRYLAWIRTLPCSKSQPSDKIDSVTLVQRFARRITHEPDFAGQWQIAHGGCRPFDSASLRPAQRSWSARSAIRLWARAMWRVYSARE